MTNLILYISFKKIKTHVYIEDDTVYVDAIWYRKLCDKLKGEWELDKHIYSITKCKYLRYTFHGEFRYLIQNKHGKEGKWEWDEQEQRYK